MPGALSGSVPAQHGTATPLVESGSGSAGTSLLYSGQDHVHPASGGGLTSQSVNLASDATITVGANLLCAVTPAAGTYFVEWGLTFVPGASTTGVEVIFDTAGSFDTSGTWSGSSTSTTELTLSGAGLTTVNGSQVIEMDAVAVGASATAKAVGVNAVGHATYLRLLKVA